MPFSMGPQLNTGPSSGFLSRLGQVNAQPGMARDNTMGRPTMGGRMGNRPMPRAGMPNTMTPDPNRLKPQGMPPQGMPNIVQGPNDMQTMPGMQPSAPTPGTIGMGGGMGMPPGLMDPNRFTGGRLEMSGPNAQPMQPQQGGIFDRYRQMNQRMPQRQY